MSASDVLLKANLISCNKAKDDYILKDVNLSVYQGDVIVIHGKSGCGYEFHRLPDSEVILA